MITFAYLGTNTCQPLQICNPRGSIIGRDGWDFWMSGPDQSLEEAPGEQQPDEHFSASLPPRWDLRWDPAHGISLQLAPRTRGQIPSWPRRALLSKPTVSPAWFGITHTPGRSLYCCDTPAADAKGSGKGKRAMMGCSHIPTRASSWDTSPRPRKHTSF